jgi:hypothetical protein
MIKKPAENLTEVETYQPISLLSIMLKLSEKLILKRLKLIIEEKYRVPTHQFGFRKKSLNNRPGALYHQHH